MNYVSVKKSVYITTKRCVRSTFSHHLMATFNPKTIRWVLRLSLFCLLSLCFRSHFTSSRSKCQLPTGLHKARDRVLFYRLAPERRPGLFQGDPYNLHEFHEIVPSITFSINEYQFSAKWSLIPAESWQHELFFPIERLFHWSGHNTRLELVFGVITVMVWISNLKQVYVQTDSS